MLFQLLSLVLIVSGSSTAPVVDRQVLQKILQDTPAQKALRFDVTKVLDEIDTAMIGAASHGQETVVIDIAKCTHKSDNYTLRELVVRELIKRNGLSVYKAKWAGMRMAIWISWSYDPAIPAAAYD